MMPSMTPMSYSRILPPPPPRPRALQTTALGCVAAAIADAVGDLCNWTAEGKLEAQHLLIKDLGLATKTTDLAEAAKSARLRFGSRCSFKVVPIDLAEAVQYACQGAGVVVGLASLIPDRPGHAYHLLRGTFPMEDPDLHLSRVEAAQQKAMDDLQEEVTLWDPSDGTIATEAYGSVRRRFERIREVLVIQQLRETR